MGMALLTLVAVSILDYWFARGYESLPLFQQTMAAVLTFPWGLVTMAMVGLGIGGLAVFLLETFCTQLVIHASTLWALILCLLLGLWLKSFLYLPGLFVVGLSQSVLVGLVLGVFWKGRRYWR